jgi:hypothetical protein
MLLAALGGSAVGCGGKGRSGGEGGDMQAGGGGGGGVGGSGGGAGSGGSGTADLGWALSASLGIYQLHSVDTDSYSTHVFAYFIEPSDVPQPPTTSPVSCSNDAISSACSVSTCVTNPVGDMAMPHDLAIGPRDFALATVDLGGPDMARPLVHVNGGSITVSGLSAPLTLTPGADGYYAGLIGTTALWPPATAPTVAFHAAGSSRVAAFSIDVVPPLPLTLTSPVVPAAGTLTIDRGHDLPLVWTGGDGGQLTFWLQSWTDDALRSATLACTFDGGAHGATIPAAALQPLVAGMKAQTNGMLATTRTTWNGPVVYNVTAQTLASWANGHQVALTVQLK